MEVCLLSIRYKIGDDSLTRPVMVTSNEVARQKANELIAAFSELALREVVGGGTVKDALRSFGVDVVEAVATPFVVTGLVEL